MKNQENPTLLPQSARSSKCGRKGKFTVKTNRKLFNIARLNRRLILFEMSTLSNEKTPYKLSKRTIQRRYHEKRDNERVGKKSTIISKQKRLKRRIICRYKSHCIASRN